MGSRLNVYKLFSVIIFVDFHTTEVARFEATRTVIKSIQYAFFHILIIMFEFQRSEKDCGPRQLRQLRQMTFSCLAKLQPQSVANTFHSLHHDIKIYLLTGFIMIIVPRVFIIHNQA